MAVPPDMLAALQGGGAPAPAAGPMGGPESIPPDMMAMLAGAGGPGAEAGPPPGEAPLPSITDGAPGGGEDALVLALDALQDAIDAESDQEDIQVMLQCQAKLQQILAKNQSEGDQMMAGKMNPRALRKAL